MIARFAADELAEVAQRPRRARNSEGAEEQMVP